MANVPSTILCILCQHLGLGHDGDHIVPGPCGHCDGPHAHRDCPSIPLLSR